MKAKKFALCGKYLVSEKSYGRIAELFELHHSYAEQQKSSAEKKLELQIVEHEFMKDAATLIALLVLNDRKPEAEKIAERVRSKSKYPDRDKVIDAALQGKIPELQFE